MGECMIQGINNQAGLYAAYNRVQENRQSDNVRHTIGSNIESRPDEQVSERESSRAMDLRLDSIKPRQNVKLENLSLSLNQGSDSFEMKGRDSDIELLDMEKAVSDMQKDKALMQYQYFVGDSEPFVNNSDGLVIPK